MSLSIRRSRSTLHFLIGGLFALVILYAVARNSTHVRNFLSYSTRPLWDRSDGPQEVVPHFYGEGLDMDDKTCRLHGWPRRHENGSIIVLDAVLMNNEVDLLEIRMHELDSIVDYFLIVESNATFTGLLKETFFANNRHRFAKFNRKIVYRYIPGYALLEGQSPWDVESHTRDTMTMLINSHNKGFAPNTHVLVMMSDVDEIPASHTVALLKNCNFGSSIHLQLRDYLYSFEWFIGFTSWRASAQIWNENSYYRHSKSGERILADSGWHCSYCFRTISEYALKMRGFSHADRIAGRIDLLDPRRIQDTICRGKDIFGMLPEAYSYLDLLSQLSLKPLKSAVGLPRYLIQNSERFRFLLPGGCLRDRWARYMSRRTGNHRNTPTVLLAVTICAVGHSLTLSGARWWQVEVLQEYLGIQSDIIT